MSRIVAIVGRPNVGKSTLFNRLVGGRRAIMDDTSGVTRDRHYGDAEWTDQSFTVIDTGGYVVGSEDTFEEAIRQQVEVAMEEADVLLFMVDCIAGLSPLDAEFADVLRESKKPVLVVANKADSPQKQMMAAEFYELGFEQVFPVSSEHGSGTGELLDAVVEKLPPQPTPPKTPDLPRIAVIGKPNVGKSSFVNLLTGQERSIVTEVAGTTRDAIDSTYRAFGHEFILTDTAGLRKKSRTKDNIEFYSTIRAVKALEGAEVCAFLVDATEGLQAQDVNIAWLAARRKKGMVLLVNKWDLVEKDHRTADQLRQEFLQRLSPLDYLPVLFTSIPEKQRVHKAVETLVRVWENRRKRIPTHQLNEALLPEIERNPPPATKGKYLHIKYVSQLPTEAPSFAFFCNLPQYVKEPYRRFLENLLRKYFDFEGVPVQVFIRKK